MEGSEYCVHAKHIINLPGLRGVSSCVLYVFLPSFRVQKYRAIYCRANIFMFKYFDPMKWGMVTAFITALEILTKCMLAQPPKRFDILITEIFPDPTPSVGMPATEFIEIKNVSDTPLNLKDWKIGDNGSEATININFILDPDSIVIICSNSATSTFAAFGKTIGVSNFPSLDNEGDIIFLRSVHGNIIHAVGYNRQWFRNDLKSNGGWSLEMIDTGNPCAGPSNWNTSSNPDGGTPGRKNSIDGPNRDTIAPALLKSYALDSLTLVATFDEPVDSLSASVALKYRLDKEPSNPSMSIPLGPIFSEVLIKFQAPLRERTTYHLSVSNIADCVGNAIGTRNVVKTGTPSPADTFDIVINEILFNPKGDGFDFMELYNRSDKVIDLSQLNSANRNSTGRLRNIIQLFNKPYLLFPGEFVVFTASVAWLRQNYLLTNYDNIIEVATLPSLPDDEGTLILIHSQGKIIDELSYDSKWHFALIENQEGISLERIDYSSATQNKFNWTSAASTSGYATPGYQNSQFKSDIGMQGAISVNPKLFSPDNDGLDDVSVISYQMMSTGFVANVTIFDANGKQVRYLAKNATLSLQGKFHWDGLDDDQQRLPMGIYVVFTEVFNLAGKTKKFRNAITLARKF